MATQTLLTRRAVFAPDTFNADAGTVEAVISTFAPVQRKGFMERLDPAGLDTSRLIGAPVLDGHRQGSARDVIGTIAGHRMEDGKLVATIRLSGAADAVPIVERIREGTIKGVSIGYRVTRWADSTDPNSRARVRTAAAWSISEVSAVPIPADPGSQFRGENMPQDEIETVENPAVETATETRAAIRQICRSANMTAEQADDMIDRDLSITEARAEAFEAMQRRTPARIRTAAPANDDPAVTMTRRADALYARVSGEAPSDEARPFMGESLRDMARACVEASGVSTRAMEADTLFRAAMNTTSDFPNLLTSTGNRTLTAAYQAAQSPVKTALARRSTMADFRPGTRLKLSDIGTLEKVSESGEITHTSRGEASESYALDTYATQFAISRKALINDDLGAFRDWGSTAGRMAAETEANLLLTMLLSNPTMNEDGKALFHADHGNLASTGLALGDAGAGLTALSGARLALRGMKALDGKTPINATPKFLLVGPEQETIAEQLLAEIAAATVDEVNPFAKRLSLLVEPRITDNQWFVFADPAQLPVLEYSYLSSAQGPQMASREGWDVLGMEFRVVLDFGCGAVDWRGAYMNAGE
ncbi:prohead protease/major capsid protein fusion protein [Thioclava sp.]|uniref:prohead protease/major capsid protein fusion protein n=1 Tax=Thioclava sp. TaxID=1933450 RepID=UPI003AA972B6